VSRHDVAEHLGVRHLTKKQTTVEQVETASEQAQAAEKFAYFSTWIGIYGSDGAVRAFHNFMQAAYHALPSAVLLRLYGNFLMEARKDMGYPDTVVHREHILGIKINDIYDRSNMIDSSLEEICQRLG
jgi:hypothetical protein